MDSNKNIRSKTEVEDKNTRIATVFENHQRIATEFENAGIVDNNGLADMVKLKAEFVSVNEKKYTFNRILSVEGGEGIVAVCSNIEYGDVAVKIYIDVKNVDFGKRQRIIRFTNTENAEKYVLPIIDSGFIEFESGTMNYFEVQPLCVDGDLLHKGKFEYEELVDVISELNEGLHFIHENGFLHMDIKPENIYSYNNHYVFGDFGITRELKEGKAVTKITHIGKTISGTPGYQAPEVLYGTAYYQLTSKTDYYALAVTIASLYQGKFVFSNVDGEYDAAVFQESAQSSHINLKNTSDKKVLFLQNLIDGLFQFDKNKRFGYEDVCKWLMNPKYKGALENFSANKVNWSSPFQGSSKNDLLYTEKDLFNWIVNNWEEAKKRLYRHDFIIHFQKNNEAFVAGEIENIVEIKYPDGINNDKALFEVCLLIYSEMDTPLVWRGERWNSLQIVADEILFSDNPEFYAEMFENELISLWIGKTGLLDKDDRQMELIIDIEKRAKNNALVSCFWFAYIYASKQEIQIKKMSFDSPIELIDRFMDSPAAFYAEGGYLEWLQDLDESCKFFGFLCSGGAEHIGCAEYVYTYLNENVSDLTKKVHLLFALFEQIGISLNQESVVDKVRRTYLTYGPYGDITYIHTLVKSTNYFCSDYKDGNEIINAIKNYKEVCVGTITDMGREQIELKKLTDRLYEKMQNNPLLAQAGIYNNKLIKCRNLQGYYLYKYLNRVVPLGYRKLIETR